MTISHQYNRLDRLFHTPWTRPSINLGIRRLPSLPLAGSLRRQQNVARSCGMGLCTLQISTMRHNLLVHWVPPHYRATLVHYQVSFSPSLDYLRLPAERSCIPTGSLSIVGGAVAPLPAYIIPIYFLKGLLLAGMSSLPFQPACMSIFHKNRIFKLQHNNQKI